MIVNQPREVSTPGQSPNQNPARHDATLKSTSHQEHNVHPLHRHNEPDMEACLRALRLVIEGGKGPGDEG